MQNNSLSNRTAKLEQKVSTIEERNRRVEADKVWEKSIGRRIIITILTYVVVVVFFITAKLPNPFRNALVPTIAFILSTLSLELLRRTWRK